MDKLKGLKTFIVCAAMVVVVGYELVTTGSLNHELLLQAAALAGLRHAVN